MCLQKSNLCTTFCLWCHFACLPDALCCALLWHPLLFCAQCFVHLPTVYTLFLAAFSCCYPFSFSACLAALLCRPLLWGLSLLPIAAGVGPWQQQMLWCWSLLDPLTRLCRGESHSGALLALSPLLPALVLLCPSHIAYIFSAIYFTSIESH